MVTKKPKGLGLGLEALLGPKVSDAAPPEGAPTSLPLDVLQPGRYQPRTRMDEGSLYELAESIKSQGIMQPVLVRPVAEGRYEIIAGERRFRAARLAGLDRVPVLVKPVPDESAAVMALIENIQREDLNAIDEAHGLQRLIQEFGMTHDAVAQSVGKSRATVSNLLRLLNLSKPVQDMLTAGLIEMGHARALLPLSAGQQRELAHEIEEKGLSVREAERKVAKLKSGAASRPAKKTVPRDIRRLEEALSETLGMEAKVHMSRKGGRLTLGFADADQLQDMLEKLGVSL